MNEEIIAKTVRELRAEAEIDIFDVGFIAEGLREDLELKEQSEMRECSLEVIRRLIESDVCPGDYVDGTRVAFWVGEPADWLKRIEMEWLARGSTPTFEDPICWFGLDKHRSQAGNGSDTDAFRRQ